MATSQLPGHVTQDDAAAALAFFGSGSHSMQLGEVETLDQPALLARLVLADGAPSAPVVGRTLMANNAPAVAPPSEPNAADDYRYMWVTTHAPAGVYYGTAASMPFPGHAFHSPAIAPTVEGIQEALGYCVTMGVVPIFRGPSGLPGYEVGYSMVAVQAAEAVAPPSTPAPAQVPPIGIPLLESLDVSSPLRDFKAFVALSPAQPEVGRVSTSTGGRHSRSRADILRDLHSAVGAHARRTAQQPHVQPLSDVSDDSGSESGSVPSVVSPEYSSSSEADESSAAEPPPSLPSARAAAPPTPGGGLLVTGVQPPPAASSGSSGLLQQQQQQPIQQPVQQQQPLPPPPPPMPIYAMPPVAHDPQWRPRRRLVSAMTALYQRSFYEPGNPCMPPNLDNHSGGRRSEFTDAAGRRYGRGPVGRAALFLRDYLLVPHAEHLPRACVAPLASDVAGVCHELMGFMTVVPGTYDAAVFALASLVWTDFAEARATAMADPLVTRFGRLMPVSRASRIDCCTSAIAHGAVAMLALVVGVVGAACAMSHASPMSLAALPGLHLPPDVDGVDPHAVLDAGMPWPTRLPPPQPVCDSACITCGVYLAFVINLLLRCTLTGPRRQANLAPRPAISIFHRWHRRGLLALLVTVFTLLPLARPWWYLFRWLWRRLTCVVVSVIGIATMALAACAGDAPLCASASRVALLPSVRSRLSSVAIRSAASTTATVCPGVAEAVRAGGGTGSKEFDRYLNPPPAPPRHRNIHRVRRERVVRHRDRVHGCERDCLLGYCPIAGRACSARNEPLPEAHRSSAAATTAAQDVPPEVQLKCKISAYRAIKGAAVSLMIHAVMDSGCTLHCHPTQSDLINFRPMREVMVGIDGARCDVIGIGDLPIVAKDYSGARVNLLIRNVRCVPSFTDTLLSVEQFWADSKVEVRFADHRSLYVPADSTTSPKLRLPFAHRDGLYKWTVASASRYDDVSSSAPALPSGDFGRALMSAGRASDDPFVRRVELVHGAKATSQLRHASSDVLVDTLHRRLHVNQDTIRSLPAQSADVPDKAARGQSHSCPHCVSANAQKLAHHRKPYEPSHVGRLVHADIVGPFVKSSIGGFAYLLVLVDDHSRYVSIYFLQRKSDAPEKIRNYVAGLNRLVTGEAASATRIVGTLHTDNAGEFLSHEFSEFLDSQLIAHTTCPPHIHELNGVAERAIRALVENMRSNINMSKMPVSFWNYVAEHSVDVLNRTTGPPGSNLSSYETLTGKKPRILPIMPFGCRCFAVKPRVAYSKTRIEDHGWAGMHLGKVPTIPGAYYVWLPGVDKVVHASEVYFDETYFPWRPAEDRRLGTPIAVPAETDPDATALREAAGDADLPPAAELGSTGLAEAYDNATRGPAGIARRSTKVLVIFSGPQSRPDGLAVFLARAGLECVMFDNDPVSGGGARQDLLNDSVFKALLARIQSGEFLAIVAAPPCSTFSIARFFKPRDGNRGAPVLRTRAHILGVPGLDASKAAEVKNANSLLFRTVALLAAGHAVGTQFILENPADRGVPADRDLFIDESHGPIWRVPEVLGLKRATSASVCTFPMCAFGSPWQKFTTLMHSAGFDSWLTPLAGIRCPHHKHDAPAGGEVDSNGVWVSREAAAYPANLNLYLARAIVSLHTGASAPARSDPEVGRGSRGPVDADGGAADDGAPAVAGPVDDITASEPPPSPREATVPLSPNVVPPPVSPTGGGTARQRRTSAEVTAAGERNPSRREPHATRSRALSAVQGACFLVLGTALSVARQSVLPCAYSATAATVADPPHRNAAMRQDPAGWTAAELAELENHRQAESFSWQNRSRVPPGRKLVKMTWAYKVKRSGKLKARLCVQGCSQIPGVDYDQTHCSTMRSGSLRLLSALAAKHGLSMRRWDFVAAFLQGELLDDEVVYCSAPPGYPRVGSDGQPQVVRIQKPIYGMAQAGRRWQRTLYPWMREQLGADSQLFSDSNVFSCVRTNVVEGVSRVERLIVGCYVDDLYILASHQDAGSLYDQFTTRLQKRWEVEDEGVVSDLLGIEISSTGSVVELKQESYINKLVAIWFPDGVPSTMQSTKTPADSDLAQHVANALSCDAPRSAEDIRRFQSIVGALLYASTNTRPDIAYAVGMLCRCMGKPTPALQEAALRVLGYLYRTRHLGLRYAADSAPAYGMTDSDWATKHSTTGWVFMYNQAAISWSSKKQTSVALSSCEAEIMAASEAAKEGVHLQRFLSELKDGSSAPLALSTDNTGARDLAYNPEHHQRVKHIERRHFFIRECVENMHLTVPYVNTLNNIADFFTKPLCSKQFFKFRDQIMNVAPEHRHQHSQRALRAVRADRSPGGSTDGGVLDDGLGSLTAEVISALPVAPTVPVGPAHSALDIPRVYVPGMSA